jgi:hypothetical protein
MGQKRRQRDLQKDQKRSVVGFREKISRWLEKDVGVGNDTGWTVDTYMCCRARGSQALKTSGSRAKGSARPPPSCRSTPRPLGRLDISSRAACRSRCIMCMPSDGVMLLCRASEYWSACAIHAPSAPHGKPCPLTRPVFPVRPVSQPCL